MEKRSDRIFLVGPMGAGKTTIGRRLAVRLGYEFVDSDKEVEKRTGVAIPVIFEIEGEDGFRRREAQMIDELSQRNRIILATGGGAVVTAENRDALTRGVVVYLKTTVDRQLERTRHDRNRPLLQTADPRARLQELMEQREPLYRQLADLEIDTDQGNVRTIVKELAQRLNRRARTAETPQ